MALQDFFRRIERNIIDRAVIPAFTRQMANIGEEARRNAPRSRIGEAIEILPVEEQDGRVVGTIRVDLNIAPEARAYEFGSGIHSTQGDASTYPIPKDPLPYPLVFLWENEPLEVKERFPHDEQGRIIIRKVMHPGVEPRPYLFPAVNRLFPRLLRGVVGATIDVVFIELENTTLE